MNSKPSVCTIIVTFNGMPWIEKCLRSLKKSTYGTRIIVVDNNSSDGTAEFITTNFDEIQLIRQSENLGFGKANNIGIKEALKQTADYLFLLNQDIYVNPDTIEHLISTYEEDKAIGILSPIHLAPNGSLDFGFEDHIKRYAGQKIFEEVIRRDGKVMEVGFVNAACWMLSKETIMKVGGFNPIFPHYGEDNDYVNRVKFFDLRLKVATGAEIVHDREQSEAMSTFKKLRNRELVAYTKHITNISIPLFKSFIIVIDKLIRESVYYTLKLKLKRVAAIILSFLEAMFSVARMVRSRAKSKKEGAYL